MSEHRIVLECIISRLWSKKPWRERTPCGIGREVVRASSAVGAGVEVEDMFPGEVLECLYPKRFHLVQMLIADSPLHWLQRAFIQLREVNVEQRSLYVELNSKWPIAEQEIEGHRMKQICAEVQAR